MNIEQVRDLCLLQPNVSESFPFDEETLVMKVEGKMFALIPLEKDPKMIALKCDPDRSEKLRQHYNGISGAWHMNQTHWNQVTIESDVPDTLIERLIRHSYYLVIQGLPKAIRSREPYLSYPDDEY